MPTPIKVLFLAAEAEPYQKVGGLADVAGSLPVALRALSPDDTDGVRLDIRLVLPLHKSTKVKVDALHLVTEFTINRWGGSLIARVFQLSRNQMPVYFIDGDLISSAPTIYSNDLSSDRQKFAFFSLAALEMLGNIGWKPDIIHANDWHTALALFALKARLWNSSPGKIHSLLTVHNLPFMGGDASDVLSSYALTPPTDEILPQWARTQPLPLGLWAADAIVPVSPTYAGEILTPAYGCGLETYLETRKENITGILNGLDLASFNPESDKDLAVNYAADSLDDRAGNKHALLQKLGLSSEASVPILGMVGRIDQQKGVDLAIQVLENLGDHRWQFVLLGSGDPKLEEAVRSLQNRYPDRVRGIFRYDAELARLIYGGADIFMMPSRYEPCGLAQMIAMRYGCVPIVCATGGLKDTVRDGITGFLFQEASAEAMRGALVRALSAFTTQRSKWREFQRNGMAEDFSWLHSARQYAKIYRSFIAS